MSLTLINEYANTGNPDVDSIALTLDQTRIGFHSVSLTNFDNTTIPAIAEGSVLEVDGALYSAGAEESISESPSDGNVYVKIIPNGATATAEFTNTAPVWDSIKQGWYSPTGGEESYRYLNFKIVKATASYKKYSIAPVILADLDSQVYTGTNNVYTVLPIGTTIIGDIHGTPFPTFLEMNSHHSVYNGAVATYMIDTDRIGGSPLMTGTWSIRGISHITFDGIGGFYASYLAQRIL